MSNRTWALIGFVLMAGMLLSILAFPGFLNAGDQLYLFLILVVLTTITHLVSVIGPSHEAWNANLLFLCAGFLLLHPFFFVLLVVIPHSIEWAKQRITKSKRLSKWYIQPFNMAGHIIAGSAARQALVAIQGGADLALTPIGILAVIGATLTYVLVNHFQIATIISLARRIPLRDSGILDISNLLTDWILLLMGGTCALAWTVSPWLAPLPLAPLVLVYQALQIPQLKKEAATDDKTGLWNTREFAKLLAAEMKRAQRFGHSLALIMADLDLLRNVNNTYGHLAGDAVLTSVGRIIRNNLREYDIAGRFGGEEFVIALPETDLEPARDIADRIRQAIQSTYFAIPTQTTPIRATMSFGVACLDQANATPTALIHEADIAVYQAKLQGRNRVVCAPEVPHTVRLSDISLEERFGPSFVETIAQSQAPSVTPPTPQVQAPAPSFGTARFPRGLLPVWVTAVILSGLIAALIGVMMQPLPDGFVILLFGLLAVAAESMQVRLGYSTVSVSVAIIFAAALVTRVPGAACISLAVVLTHYVRRRPRPYKVAYNWATHLLAVMPPLLILNIVPWRLRLDDLPWLIVPMGIAGVANYVIDTGLIAIAIGIASRTNIISIWRAQFAWLAPHYLVLALISLFLAIAYLAFGWLGAVIFALPMLMMRLAQQPYAKVTEESVSELRRMNQELSLANQEIRAASATIQALNEGLFVTLAKIIDARDPYVSGHSAQVARYATAIAAEMGLPPPRVEQINQAALLHDIGKIGISERVLNKSSRLAPDEYEYVKSHAILGEEFLKASPSLASLAPFIRHHHEWWDGRGYPDGLKMQQIPLESRILALCDAVESMASDRPYHPAIRLSSIVAEITGCAGTQFDPEVVAVLVRILEREGEKLVVNSAREVAQKSELASLHGGEGLGGAVVPVWLS